MKQLLCICIITFLFTSGIYSKGNVRNHQVPMQKKHKEPTELPTPIVVSPWVQSFDSAFAYVCLNADLPVQVKKGPVPFNQLGVISKNMTYDPNKQEITVNEPGVYAIDYFVKTYDETSVLLGDTKAGICVCINGKEQGKAYLVSSYVDADCFESCAHRQLLCDLRLGSTVGLHIFSLFDESVESRYAHNEIGAYLCIRKIG